MALLLQRVPDARRSRVPLFPAVAFPYVALMLGTAAAALLALYNAVALRRAKPVVAAAVLGVLGWLGFGLLTGLVFSQGLHDRSLALLPARLLSVGLGALLAWSQWAYVRGHDFLDGADISLVRVVVVAFAAVMLLSLRHLLLLQGLWQILLLR